MALQFQFPIKFNFPSFRRIDEQLSSRVRLWEPQQPGPRGLIVVCSSKRSRKPAKNNQEICSEIRDFIVQSGLPEDRLPSMKELSMHGRKDLANILRRRGYKVIGELLKSSLDKNKETEGSMGEDKEMRWSKDDPSAYPQNNLSDSAEGISVSSEPAVTKEHLVSSNGTIHAGTSTTKEQSILSSESYFAKATNFIQTGEFDPLEGASGVEHLDADTPSDLSFSHVTDTCEGASGTEELDVDTDGDTGLSGVVDTSKGLSVIEDLDVRTILDTNSSHVADTGITSDELPSNLMKRHHCSGRLMSSQEQRRAALHEDIEEDENEIERLTHMLHQKELELSQLKEQIEKEQLSLAMLQVKAKTEIGSANKMLSAKDMELLAAEESLSGLKEVPITFWANGETVELAGSFNGWHHRIRMDLHPSSKIITKPSSRSSKLWSTVLWLYPGVYEIKFIVDSQWQIDSEREVSSKGGITNNILRVDR